MHRPDESAHAARQGRPAEPFLSIVLTGRNDGYGGDFVARLARTLQFNHRQLDARGITHEFVFVEWAPLRDRRWLIDILFDAATELDRRVFTWYVVDPKYHTVLSLNPRLEYLEFLAKNVGVRRARGQYVVSSNSDVYLGRHVLDTIKAGALKARVLYRAPRHDLAAQPATSVPDWDLLEDPRSLAGPAHVLKRPYLGSATGDFAMLDRESFHEIRGFNEVYRVARIGIDRNILVKVLSAGFTIADIGGPVYHENHEGSYRLNPHAYAGREAEAPWGDRRWHSGGVSYVNPPTWGLALAPAQPAAGGSVYLDFSWEAVPPLVDLKAVVVPTARRGGPTPGRYVRKR